MSDLTRKPTVCCRLPGAVATYGLVFACASACTRSASLPLADTESRHFVALVKHDEVVALEPKDGSESGPVILHDAGRLVAVCPKANALLNAANGECRALVCKKDTDCPPAHGLKQGTCVNGLCIEPAHPVVADDAIMLCLAGTGLGRQSPRQADLFALGLNCGSPCQVPKPCRQP